MDNKKRNNKILILFLLLIPALIFCSCNGESDTSHLSNNTNSHLVVRFSDLLDGLEDDEFEGLREYTKWISHPLSEVIERYGTGYEIIWDVNENRPDELKPYLTLKYKETGVSFVANTNFRFVCLTTYGGYTNFRDLNPMEYIPQLIISEVVFSDTFELFEGVHIGDSLDAIADKKGYSGITVEDMSYYREETEAGISYVRSCVVERDSYEGYITVRDHTLEKVRVLASFNGLPGKSNEAAELRPYLEEAVKYVNANGLARYNVNQLSYDAYRYIPSFDAWVHCWKFGNGTYKDTYLCVEAAEPHRILAMNSTHEHLFIFWEDGHFVHPILSFLGKWRRADSNSYIDIKAISSGGEVIFDMCKNGTLIKNINASLSYGFFNFNDLYSQDAFALASVQYATDEDYSGFIFYAGYQPMSDKFFLDFGGEVSYVGSIGRGGVEGLTIHLPYRGDYNSVDFDSGLMNYFGSSDNGKNAAVAGGNKKAERDLINRYMNEANMTKDIDYASSNFNYAHDYVYPVNGKTYSVWKSNINDNSFLLYVDTETGMIIKEIYDGPLTGYIKMKVYENGRTIEGQKSLPAALYSPDGNITFKLDTRARFIIEKKDAFIPSIRDVELTVQNGTYYSTICTDYMFYVKTGTHYVLGGYVSYNHLTWSYTLHITNSNISGWNLGIYPLYEDSVLGNVFFMDADSETEASEAINQVDTEYTTICIRDKSYRILGYVMVDKDGNKTVRDKTYKILGYYRSSNDATYDAKWTMVCFGDAVVSMLFD